MENVWFGFNFQVVTEDCDLTAGNSAYDAFQSCKKYTYSHNANNGHAYVRNADGSYYQFSKPRLLKLANFDPSTQDRNYQYAQKALENQVFPEMGLVRHNQWNPVTGRSCDVENWAAEFATMANDGNPIEGLPLIYPDDLSDNPDPSLANSEKACLVPVAPDYFAGKTFYLNYDGRALHGINGVNNELTERWYQMVNLKSGTELVDVNDPTKVYKDKPVYIDEYLQNLTLNLDPISDNQNEVDAIIDDAKTACADEGIVFELDGSDNDSLAMLELLDNLPPVWFDDTYVKPSISWSDRPTVTPTGNCFVKDKEVICPAD